MCERDLVLIEAKRDVKHDLTPQQKATKREFLDAGATVFLVYDEATADYAHNYLVRQMPRTEWHTCGCGQWVHNELAPCTVCKRESPCK